MLALGNIRALTPKAVAAIEKLMSSDCGDGDTVLGLAFESWRKDGCEPKLKFLARQIFTDESKYSDDIRTQAYFAMLRCMDDEDVAVLNSLLKQSSHSPGKYGFRMKVQFKIRRNSGKSLVFHYGMDHRHSC